MRLLISNKPVQATRQENIGSSILSHILHFQRKRKKTTQKNPLKFGFILRYIYQEIKVYILSILLVYYLQLNWTSE